MVAVTSKLDGAGMLVKTVTGAFFADSNCRTDIPTNGSHNCSKTNIVSNHYDANCRRWHHFVIKTFEDATYMNSAVTGRSQSHRIEKSYSKHGLLVVRIAPLSSKSTTR